MSDARYQDSATLLLTGTGGRRHGLARLISALTNPGPLALPPFLVVALHTALSVGLSLWWWLITTAGISAAPLLYVYLGVRAGRYLYRPASPAS